MSPDPQPDAARDKLRVLLIDDHTLFRSGLRELLQRRGIEVVAAVGDGGEGCRLAAELEPNVVLLDLRMPEIDGLAVLKKLNEQKLGIHSGMRVHRRDPGHGPHGLRRRPRSALGTAGRGLHLQQEPGRGGLSGRASLPARDGRRVVESRDRRPPGRPLLPPGHEVEN